MKWPVIPHNGDTRGMYSHRIIGIQHHIGDDREKSWKKLKRGRRRWKKGRWDEEWRVQGLLQELLLAPVLSAASSPWIIWLQHEDVFADRSLWTMFIYHIPLLRTDCLLICVTDFMISMEDILNSIPKGRYSKNKLLQWQLQWVVCRGESLYLCLKICEEIVYIKKDGWKMVIIEAFCVLNSFSLLLS